MLKNGFFYKSYNQNLYHIYEGVTPAKDSHRHVVIAVKIEYKEAGKSFKLEAFFMNELVCLLIHLQ